MRATGLDPLFFDQRFHRRNTQSAREPVRGFGWNVGGKGGSKTKVTTRIFPTRVQQTTTLVRTLSGVTSPTEKFANILGAKQTRLSPPAREQSMRLPKLAGTIGWFPFHHASSVKRVLSVLPAGLPQMPHYQTENDIPGEAGKEGGNESPPDGSGRTHAVVMESMMRSKKVQRQVGCVASRWPGLKIGHCP